MELQVKSHPKMVLQNQMRVYLEQKPQKVPVARVQPFRIQKWMVVKDILDQHNLMARDKRTNI